MGGYDLCHRLLEARKFSHNFPYLSLVCRLSGSLVYGGTLWTREYGKREPPKSDVTQTR